MPTAYMYIVETFGDVTICHCCFWRADCAVVARRSNYRNSVSGV